MTESPDLKKAMNDMAELTRQMKEKVKSWSSATADDIREKIKGELKDMTKKKRDLNTNIEKLSYATMGFRLENKQNGKAKPKK